MADALGFDVKLRFAPHSLYVYALVSEAVLHNITEIHYRYQKSYANAPDRVVFESDVHGTGQTYVLADIAGFEARLATEKAEAF